MTVESHDWTVTLVKPTFLNLPEKKRAQIEDAATDEFARFPYAKASISRIVERVGIAKGSVYQYFENKQALYLWLMKRAALKKLEYFDGPVTPEPGGMFDWMERALYGGLRFAIAHPRIARIGLASLHSRDPAVSSFSTAARKAGLEFSVRLFREAQLHGEVREDLDPTLLAILFQSTQNSLLEILRARAGVESEVELFDGEVMKQFSEDELKRLVHQLIEVFQQGTATQDGPRVVRDAPRTSEADLEQTLAAIFDGAKGATE